MKKIIIAFLISIFAIGVFTSCNKDKTIAQRIKEEKKIIQRFIDQNNIKVLTEYPADSTFRENDFYLDQSSGVYYNVIAPGNSRKIQQGEEVYIRFKGLKYIENADTLVYSNIFSPQPDIIEYGNSVTYLTNAWVVPLKNIGDRAKVKMIVPSSMGLRVDKEEWKTAYYEEIDYRFEQ